MAIFKRPPRVSVVTPFYNAEAYIAETIESVLQQSYKDFEYILVDDGSTDGGRSIVESYLGRSSGVMRIISHEGDLNRGLPSSRNLGYCAARGEFIAPLDADDVWLSDKLAAQVSLLDQYPDVGMVCGSAIYWSSWNGGTDRLVKSGYVHDRVVYPPEAALQAYPLGPGNAPSPSDWLVRREAIEKIGGWEEQFSGARALFEDQAFLAKLYVDFPIYFSNRTLLKYRIHEHSIMASVASSGQKSRVRLFFFDWLVDFYRTKYRSKNSLLRKAKERRWELRRAYLRERLRGALRRPVKAVLSPFRSKESG